MIDAPIRAEAPGKVILLGEHAVVYGALALGFPLDRAIRVEVAPRAPVTFASRRTRTS
jgi:mevalonate kinase